MSISDHYDELLQVPRSVRLPLELRPPEDFDPGRPETWPRVDGRLEYVDGRLLFMPPCGDYQQDTVGDLAFTLTGWARAHPEFVASTNEAGMLLEGDTRGADGAIWRRDVLAGYTGGYRRVPPVLAAEVSGRDEDEDVLREKARWYLDEGVRIVWLVLVEKREVVVLTRDAERRYCLGERLAGSPELPGLAPMVDELFTQISR